MNAYYNENNPYVAQWLRNLIQAGHIAPGYVDERSVQDVKANDLSGFTQCHFFAGIGVWSYALRRAGWPDDRPVWTGSCPCQPFSNAGRRGGFSDPRHLWPFWYRLIHEWRPVTIFGEQVAGKDGLGWLDLVQADVESDGYAIGAVVTPAAGFGAPHWRHRIYFVADRYGAGLETRERSVLSGSRGRIERGATVQRGAPGELADDNRKLGGQRGAFGTRGYSGSNAIERGRSGGDRVAIELGNAKGIARQLPDGSQRGEDLEPVGASRIDDMEHATGNRYGPQGLETVAGRRQQPTRPADGACAAGPGPTNGFWRDADWLGCTDGKWRPVEPSTFPLVDGAASRVGRLCAYGNAIVAPQTQAFIEAFMSCKP